MRLPLLLLLPPALLVLLTACGPPESRPDCFKSTGPKTTEHRALPAYTGVEVHDNIRLVVAADGQPYGAEVIAGRNLLNEINTDVTADGKLLLRNRNKCNFVRAQKLPIVVIVHIPNPHRRFTIYHLGEETVRTSEPNTPLDTLFLHQRTAGDSDLDLDSKYLWLDAYEYGDVTLRGRADELHVIMGGIGFLKAQEMSTRDAYIRGLLDGDLFVRATNLLGFKLEGRGNGYYYGQPAQTDLQALGSGKIYQVK